MKKKIHIGLLLIPTLVATLLIAACEIEREEGMGTNSLFRASLAKKSNIQTKPLLYPCNTKYTPKAAAGMARAAKGILSPIYAPLAEHIVRKFQLAEKEGIGIDVGSGPGTLIVELCKRTRMHWINADINPHFFPGFLKHAAGAGLSGRVSAIFADVHALPFRDNYADIIVSRGSLRFWENKHLAFSEIYRVLKPGGVTFIGHGFSDNLSVNVVHRIRAAREGKLLKCNVAEMESEIDKIMKSLEIEKYRIHIPKSPDSGISYGIWIEIHK
jgi:SAM-dependent methyltransferase